jgi:hypothetical protein
LSAASNPQIAQYAPNTPRITLRIAVLLIKKAAESPFTLQALVATTFWSMRLQMFYSIRI